MPSRHPTTWNDIPNLPVYRVPAQESNSRSTSEGMPRRHAHALLANVRASEFKYVCNRRDERLVAGGLAARAEQNRVFVVRPAMRRGQFESPRRRTVNLWARRRRGKGELDVANFAAFRFSCSARRPRDHVLFGDIPTPLPGGFQRRRQVLK